MFYGCSSLQTIPLLNTANANNMSYMFYGCSSLQAIPLLNTAAATYVNEMFYGCSSLQAIPPLNTANAKYMNNMFNGCSSLQSVPQLNTSNVTNVGGMFSGCCSLQAIGIAPGISFDVSNCSLSSNALNALYNALPKVSNSQTLTITGNPGANNSNTKIATDKGWTIAN
jgi:surface protein